MGRRSSISRYQARYPKAVACLSQDEDVLFTFYDFPAEHPTYGYRRLWAMLRFRDGLLTNKKAVYRILRAKKWSAMNAGALRGHECTVAFLSPRTGQGGRTGPGGGLSSSLRYAPAPGSCADCSQ